MAREIVRNSEGDVRRLRKSSFKKGSIHFNIAGSQIRKSLKWSTRFGSQLIMDGFNNFCGWWLGSE